MECEDVEDLHVEDAGWMTSRMSEAECVRSARERQQWRELVRSSSMISDLQEEDGLK